MKINDGSDKEKRELKPVDEDKRLRKKQNFQIYLEFAEKMITMDFSYN